MFTFLFATIASAAPKAELGAKSLDGWKVRLKDYRGKLVVLNFWATWCGPCREELPILARAAKEHVSPDLIFIAVSVDDRETMDKVGGAARQFGIAFPVWVGANNAAREARKELGGVEQVKDRVRDVRNRSCGRDPDAGSPL